ncbi:MAG TPA: hypothetical protein VGW12_09460 [Pyrinomonadaceae bacterium]|nr:hypothetical protein [Pyrinomonadaceae bacterium]
MSGSVYEDFVGWLERVGKSRPKPRGIAAYNFGIFESESGYIVYLVGSGEYDPEDDDWACNEDYVPREKYFELPRSFTGRKQWPGVQREVARLVKQFINSPEFKRSLLARASAITVGFDDGELQRVR